MRSARHFLPLKSLISEDCCEWSTCSMKTFGSFRIFLSSHTIILQWLATFLFSASSVSTYRSVGTVPQGRLHKACSGEAWKGSWSHINISPGPTILVTHSDYARDIAYASSDFTQYMYLLSLLMFSTLTTVCCSADVFRPSYPPYALRLPRLCKFNVQLTLGLG